MAGDGNPRGVPREPAAGLAGGLTLPSLRTPGGGLRAAAARAAAASSSGGSSESESDEPYSGRSGRREPEAVGPRAGEPRLAADGDWEDPAAAAADSAAAAAACGDNDAAVGAAAGSWGKSDGAAGVAAPEEVRGDLVARADEAAAAVSAGAAIARGDPGAAADAAAFAARTAPARLVRPEAPEAGLATRGLRPPAEDEPKAGGPPGDFRGDTPAPAASAAESFPHFSRAGLAPAGFVGCPETAPPVLEVAAAPGRGGFSPLGSL